MKSYFSGKIKNKIADNKHSGNLLSPSKRCYVQNDITFINYNERFTDEHDLVKTFNDHYTKVVKLKVEV